MCVNLKEEDKFKLKKEQLEEKLTDKTKAVFISYPNNPTGAVMTKEDLERSRNLRRNMT